MYKYQEKRKYKRREKPYMARLRIKQHEGLEISSAEWDIVELKDLSAGGAVLFYNKDLGIGTLLDLKIDVSKSTPTINCVGKIIRIDKTQHTSMFYITVFFIDIGEQEKELINKMTEEISE